jgi:hypothetical protein
MIRMVKVFEAIPPEVGYWAEVPGQDGRYLKAGTIPELRSKLRGALDGSAFALSSWPEPRKGTSVEGASGTSLFVIL